jgi:hypothetical protein
MVTNSPKKSVSIGEIRGKNSCVGLEVVIQIRFREVLIIQASNVDISLFDLAQMKLDLEKLFHRPVDVIEKDALKNPFRKREILRTAQVVYAG